MGYRFDGRAVSERVLPRRRSPAMAAGPAIDGTQPSPAISCSERRAYNADTTTGDAVGTTQALRVLRRWTSHTWVLRDRMTVAIPAG